MDKRWAMLVLMAIALMGCNRSPTPTPTPVTTMATPGIRSSSGPVVASGEVVPSQETHLGFPVSGRVETVAVNKGDRVEAGQVLLVLETDLLEANVALAEAALAAAQAQVVLLKASPRLEEVAVAEAQVAAAEAALAQAEVQQTRPDLGATQAEIVAAQTQVAAALADQLVTEEVHELTMQCVNVELPGGEKKKICPALGPMEERARYSMEAANQAQAAAQAQLDALLGGANAEVRVVEAGVQAVAAQRDVAQAQLETAQARATAEEITAAGTVVSQAEAALQVARAKLDQATLRAPSLQQGNEVTPSLHKGNEAAPSLQQGNEVTPSLQQGNEVTPSLQQGNEVTPSLQQGNEVAPSLQQGNEVAPSLQQGNEVAPSAGTVTALEVGPGEAVIPGQVALTLADLSRLHVETTDLSELDVGRVAVGQRASIYVEPLGVTVGGRVVRIASQAETIGGDVVYAVVVELDEQPPGLRWGMSAEVEITSD
jgi:multidrug resistance efflux pump